MTNKDTPNWYFQQYENCFISKVIQKFNFLLPTILIRLEIGNDVHGPFRALLDTGAQPMLISHTLFKRLKCTANQTTKRILGIGSCPFAITKEIDVIIRPWFDSQARVTEKAWVLPHQNTWRPVLPSKRLDVCRVDDEFRAKLADPEYYIPREVHIILGVGFVAKILNHKIGHEFDGMAIVNTEFGIVMMGEQIIDFGDSDGNNEKSLCSNGVLVDTAMEEKLNKMIERLWEIDAIGSDVKRTKEQENKRW